MSAREAVCPTCGTKFDPMRSRHVRVREGKVMAFCKDACAAADVVALPAAPPAVKPPPVVEPSPKAKPEPKIEPKAALEPGPKAEGKKPPSTVVATSPSPSESTATSTTTSTSTSMSTSVAVVEADEEVPRLRPRRRWRAALAALAVIVVGGMAIAAIQMISPGTPSRVNAAPADRDMGPAEVAPPAPPGPTPREKATKVLQELMASPSPRIVRAAAIGMMRTCDGVAKGHLVESAKTEPSEIARLEVAYVLARCGDEDGRKTLVDALKSARRDVKADAARHLIALGDDAGLSFLHALLGVTQHRLGAAEALARRKDEKAIAALGTIHDGAHTEPDDKLRAAIALGLAGDAGVKEELRIALSDPRFRPAAAAALAELGDDFARDALVDGLGVPSLRVDSARALRRLSPNLDATPLVAPLIDALATERDNSQVSAAEALLVLTGPPADAEKP